jgi:hypothetical protein
MGVRAPSQVDQTGLIIIIRDENPKKLLKLTYMMIAFKSNLKGLQLYYTECSGIKGTVRGFCYRDGLRDRPVAATPGGAPIGHS